MRWTLFTFLPFFLASDANAPHPHQGVLTPYKGAPPSVSLTETELATLASGKPVRKTVKVGDAGGRGVSVQDVKAPPEVVWKKIKDFPSYPRWVDDLDECQIYKTAGEHVFVRFKASVLGIPAEWFVDHTFKVSSGYVTWTLDYTKESDLDDSVGFWRVTSLNANPPLTRVEYSVHIRLSGWVPGALEDMLAGQGLEVATGWVKKQSEAEYAAAPK